MYIYYSFDKFLNHCIFFQFLQFDELSENFIIF
jgi:hypothetical protein